MDAMLQDMARSLPTTQVSRPERAQDSIQCPLDLCSDPKKSYDKVTCMILLQTHQDVESSDEEVEGGAEGVTVFSRSDHLLSLGFHDSPLPVTIGTGDEEWIRPKQELGKKISRPGSYKDGVGECEHTTAKGAEVHVYVLS